MKPDFTQGLRWFAEEFTARLGSVLESLAGERPQLTCVPVSATTAEAAHRCAAEHGAIWWWEQPFPLPGDPGLWAGAPQAAWSQLGSRILGDAGSNHEEQARETYQEILQQTLGELARSAGRRWSRSVDAPGHDAGTPPAEGEVYQAQCAFTDLLLPPILIVVTGGPSEPPFSAQSTAAQTAGRTPQLQSRTFDLLMGVELPVSVSFGHVQVLLKDVLKLAAGSIIELNRTVDEPVEVIVNNCVIARGEVVVVEGNYGVRIHQIMSRQERLESLP